MLCFHIANRILSKFRKFDLFEWAGNIKISRNWCWEYQPSLDKKVSKHAVVGDIGNRTWCHENISISETHFPPLQIDLKMLCFHNASRILSKFRKSVLFDVVSSMKYLIIASLFFWTNHLCIVSMLHVIDKVVPMTNVIW